jgi:hypothetical protein
MFEQELVIVPISFHCDECTRRLLLHLSNNKASY